MLIDDRDRLNKIDKLQELRLEQYVSLPMLVVGGDQSSGKSSVLEALTGLPFPRDTGLCTRFPTNIVFKRGPIAQTVASVIPLNSIEKSEPIPIRSVKNDTLGSYDLIDILDEARKLMGLSKEKDGTGKAFSEDMLKIEICGPFHEHFSVVDLPGLFRNATPGVTIEEDINFVKSMMLGFLSNSRSIIMAVVPANADLATQEIVQMAIKADANATRTLGVLTKPDLVDKGAESMVLELLENDTSKSTLGYYVVRNRNKERLGTSLKQRNAAEEEFFNEQTPWNSVAKNRAGIDALRMRLNQLAVEISRRSYPELLDEMSQALESTRSSLASLGPEITSDGDRRQFLIRTAMAFQARVDNACKALYADDECFADKKLRLATAMIRKLDVFNSMMRMKGYRYRFKRGMFKRGDQEESIGSSDSDDTPERNGYHDLLPSKKGKEVQDSHRHKNVYDWIQAEYEDSRGFEIGTVNASLLSTLFRSQIYKWPELVRDLVKDLIEVVKTFITDVLTIVCPEGRVRKKLEHHMRHNIEQSLSDVQKHINEIIEVEVVGGPFTLNHYLADTLNRIREERYRRQLSEQATWSEPNNEEATLVRLRDILDMHKNNKEQVVEDMHDTLKAYCKVARKRFVDNVTRNAKYYLTESATCPLKVFSPEFIGGLSASAMEDIMESDPEKAKKRRQLKQKQAALEEGLQILRE